LTLADLTPEMIAKFEAKRKADLAKQQRLDTDYKAMIRQEKQRAEAYWQNKQNSKIHTAKNTEHPCENCKGTIHIGEQYRSRTVTVNVSRQGWTPQQRTVYRHVKCPTKTEAQ
jgi:hypothetical protein